MLTISSPSRRTDGYTVDEVVMYWKQPNPVRGVGSSELPQFSIVRHETTDRKESLATGKSLRRGELRVSFHWARASVLPTSPCYSLLILHLISEDLSEVAKRALEHVRSLVRLLAR